MRYGSWLPQLITAVLLLSTASASAQSKPTSANDPLRRSLLLHTSFDASANADFARGDKQIYTAETLKREKLNAGLHADGVERIDQGGRYGGALRFTKKTSAVVMFRGASNTPAAKPSLQGTVAFWLRVSPDDDLPPGYVDPLQITDKKWNDASFFVDFTKDKPRQFRLGAFSDYAFWNPTDRKWDSIPEAERPLVTVKKPPFSRDRWTHVVFTFERFNNAEEAGAATLYLDGKSQGRLQRLQQLTWDPKQVAIMLGIGYTGDFDDLGIWGRALSAEEVLRLYELPNGLAGLK